jgi:hypothetical protein
MEVIGMTLSDGERTKLIDRILGKRTSGGLKVGIYGADICQLCGQTDTFRGWAYAAYGCHLGPRHEFVCRDCQHRLIPKDVTGITKRNKLVGAALRESLARYCRICARQIKRPKAWNRRGEQLVAVCAGCGDDLEKRSITESKAQDEFLQEYVRRRFLELLDERELIDQSGLVDAYCVELNEWEQEGPAEPAAHTDDDNDENETTIYFG